ncbi:hypothetical protein C8R45DRAFT_1101159 [Mycena sanguinolenta]|nr:hypothetical protein C8R45DRAFT_1101159 [Mycena sanguinolenta]
MLLDLPAELLEEIGAQLTQDDHAILRAVCKTLHDSVHRLFFSVLVLKTTRNGLSEAGIQMLHANTLHIIPAKPGDGDGAYCDGLVGLLAAALASLPKIKNVVWRAQNQGFWKRATMDRGPWTVDRFSIMDSVDLRVDLTSNGHRRDVRSSIDLPRRGPDHPVRIHPLASTLGYCHYSDYLRSQRATIYAPYIVQ